MEYTENQFNRIPVRTFGRVRGKRLSPRQQTLVEELLPKLNPAAALPRCRAATILEIGFGAGEHIIELALANPNKIIIGAEPFINGVASLLSRIAKEELGVRSGELGVKPEYKNIRIWPDDIRKLLQQFHILHSTLHTFDEIWILHPDPWPKARHEKRRLLSADFLKMLWSLISKDGKIIIGTDHADYYDWIAGQTAAAKLKISAEKMPLVKTRYQEKDMFGAGKTQYIIIEK